MIFEVMPDFDVWPLSDLVAELLRPRVERHRALRPRTTGNEMPIRPVEVVVEVFMDDASLA